MQFLRKCALLLAVVLATSTAASAGASALTVSPAGTYDAMSGYVRIELTSNGQTFTCTSWSDLWLAMPANGAGVIPLGNVSLTGCINPSVGSVRIDAPAAWPAIITLAGGSVDLTITIPVNGLRINGGGCTIWLEGTMTHTAGASTLPIGFLQWWITSSSLRVSRSSGSAFCLIAPAGLAATVEGDFEFDRIMSVAG